MDRYDIFGFGVLILVTLTLLSCFSVVAMKSAGYPAGVASGGGEAAAIMAERSAERDREMMAQFQALLTEYKAKAESAGLPLAHLVWGTVVLLGLVIGGLITMALIRRRHPEQPAAPTPVGLGYPPPHHQLPPPPPYYYGYPGAYTDAQYQVEADGRPLQQIGYHPTGHYPATIGRRTR